MGDWYLPPQRYETLVNNKGCEGCRNTVGKYIELEIVISLLIQLYMLPEATGNCVGEPFSLSAPSWPCKVLVLRASVAKACWGEGGNPQHCLVRWVILMLPPRWMLASSNYRLSMLTIHVNNVVGSLTRSLQPEVKRQVDLCPCVQSLVTFLSLHSVAVRIWKSDLFCPVLGFVDRSKDCNSFCWWY